MSEVAVNLSEVLQEARAGNSEAVEDLFSGFLGQAEVVTDCGYLGSLGFIFPEHSFWCVTDTQACSLRIKRTGQLEFSSGYVIHINSHAFYQPSLIPLWVIIAILMVFTLGLGIVLVPWVVKLYYRFKKSGVVFWVREGIPVYIFADRPNLHKAQRVATLIAEAAGSARP
jgi:hypothetical protein